ncbi:oxidoreductase/nitrogenase component 1 [Clostridium sp. DL-VIII]|uniref:nitrogenase component 1 n=1 Tax=Clostridium sp. DL-VIII TaxID=641107 RepID=UPI00023AF3C5|nr:nitrogenase component 1 [Clostridium sp. DL-VIII]EHI97198.1 oxidoreductase/nitrogenase component 1 [Clostridium sp. DL-VIII]
MSQGVEKSRNSCILQGAISTILEIDRVIPIVHSTAGCTIQQKIGDKASKYSGFDIPSTNINEKHVIFGGGSRLREEIKNTVKVVDGDLYITLSGCAPELVGDDVITMTSEAQEQGEPVIYFKAPGFKGKFHLGYEGVVNAIINQLPLITKINKAKENNLVNIFGIIPNQDIHWRGNLEELKRILDGIGLKVNTLFGFNQGIEEWRNISSAALNLVFSKWGVSIAENLKEKYEIPFINFEAVPVGAKDTISFVKEVSSILNIDAEKTEKFLREEKEKEDYYINNLLNLYFDYNFQKTFGIVGNESVVRGIDNFLSETFGLIPKVRIFTDPIQEEDEILKENEYRTEDLNEIQEILKSNNVEFVLGSSLEKEISQELNVPLLVISFPEIDKVILNKSYLGLKGGINLLEDLSTVILNYERKKQEKAGEEIKLLRKYK